MKKEKGITLISLVLTIIVLIILAGISINLILGENGIINKAKNAKKTYIEEETKETVSLMMGQYVTYRIENNKSLREYLEEQENAGKIESIEESEEGTETIIINGYQVTIDEKTLKIIEIGKAGSRPKINNLKITIVAEDGTETEVKEKEVLKGTPLKIKFDVNFDEGTLIGVNKGTLKEGKLEYITDGIETEVIFVVTGKIENEEYQNMKKVLLENFYRETYIADVVNVGDFVNYSVGNWTQADIAKLGNMYSGISQSNTQGRFSMFNVGTSKDSSINTYGTYTNQFANGWRILSKNADGTINIIHAGTCEAYYSSSSNANAGSNLLKNLRDWSMYEDSSTDSVSTCYAVIGSAHCLTKSEMEIVGINNSLRKIGVWYWTSDWTTNGPGIYFFQHNGNLVGGGNGTFGIRPVVMLKAEVKVEAASGQTTHNTPETAWILSLDVE